MHGQAAFAFSQKYPYVFAGIYTGRQEVHMFNAEDLSNVTNTQISNGEGWALGDLYFTNNDKLLVLTQDFYWDGTKSAIFTLTDSPNHTLVNRYLFTGTHNITISMDNQYMVYKNGLYSLNITAGVLTTTLLKSDLTTILSNDETSTKSGYIHASFDNSGKVLYIWQYSSGAYIYIIDYDNLEANLYKTLPSNTIANNMLVASVGPDRKCIFSSGYSVDVSYEQILTSFTRKGIKYVNTSDAMATANDILSPKTAYVNGQKITGTMPNNGELNYTPSTEEQTIPAGYTSGGKVNPMDVTTSTIYKQAITILKDIKPTVSAIYKQIDYIGGTGSQRLYTDIQTDSATDTYEITLRDTDVANWEYYFQLGAMRLARYQTRPTEFCFYAGTNRAGESFTLGNINDGNWHTIKITPNALSFDSSRKISYSVGGTSTGKINIFYPGDTTSKFLIKEFKMYRAGELISHLIPCENIQTNTVGMYDLIGNKFYNNTGSGTFTSGNTIGDIDVEDYTLKQRLLDLQDYINQNIVPTNIRADKTIFDVTGTAPVTFSTIEEMNEHTNLVEDTFAIVYGTSYIGTYKLNNGAWTQIGNSTEK